MRSQHGLKAGVDRELHGRGRLPLTQRDAGAARADAGAATAAPSRPIQLCRPRCRFGDIAEAGWSLADSGVGARRARASLSGGG